MRYFITNIFFIMSCFSGMALAATPVLETRITKENIGKVLSGIIQDIQKQDLIMINNELYLFSAQSTKIKDSNNQTVTKPNIRIGMKVEYVFTLEGGKPKITQLWILNEK